MICLYCNAPATITKYLGIPGYIIVPNEYALCAEHKDKCLRFEDVYNDDGSRKENIGWLVE